MSINSISSQNLFVEQATGAINSPDFDGNSKGVENRVLAGQGSEVRRVDIVSPQCHLKKLKSLADEGTTLAAIIAYYETAFDQENPGINGSATVLSKVVRHLEEEAVNLGVDKGSTDTKDTKVIRDSSTNDHSAESVLELDRQIEEINDGLFFDSVEKRGNLERIPLVLKQFHNYEVSEGLSLREYCAIITENNLHGPAVSSFSFDGSKLWNNGKKLTRIPKAALSLKGISEFRAPCNEIRILPSAIGDLHNLLELDLSSNNICNFPEELGQLKRLENLDLRSNKVSFIPPSTGRMEVLCTLDLSNNLIESIPAGVVSSEFLEDINLNNNKIKSLPPEIWNSGNLQKMNLSNNQLKELPALPEKMKELRSKSIIGGINLEDNLLRTLPVFLSKGYRLHVGGNSLNTFSDAAFSNSVLFRGSIFGLDEQFDDKGNMYTIGYKWSAKNGAEAF